MNAQNPDKTAKNRNEKLAALQQAGMTAQQAAAFYRLMTQKIK
jgi:hypothetical protein